MSEFCNNCPLEAALDAGKNALDEVEDSHTSTSARERALGGIELHRKLASQIIEAVECGGPRHADGAYLVCPHQRVLTSANNYFVGPDSKEAKFEAHSPNGDREVRSDGGQYL